MAKAAVQKMGVDGDVVFINTCSVTHEAERQSKQAVRRAIRENASAKIIVSGCAVKTSFDYFSNLDGVFKVMTNDEKDSLNNVGIVKDHNQFFENRARAFIQIQNGCDHFCSYCIVPIARGKSRSLPLERILDTVELFDKSGFKELVLSGIDITSYGKDLADKIELADVIKAILESYPSQKRIRISSLDPHSISPALFELFADENRIMPHFHLSAQSGDNSVLTAMRRRHNRESVIKFCSKLRAKRSDVVFGCDFIAGFPTETDEMFLNTVKLIDDAGISMLHVFPFSPRSGTLAAQMIQLPKDVVLNRAKILREKAQQAKLKLFHNMQGKIVSGIIEKCENGISYGKTDSFISFSIKKPLSTNEIASNMLITGYTENELVLWSDVP
ncbi:threonylcarbamoyladenosine tRNA methylthiotransferase MtaB [Alphaproteobacteria bacterium]|nr:threonylcarbamoyladenosine tRNA methylthiotransferase MtaB [Alphaproteobacteria bacterium]